MSIETQKQNAGEFKVIANGGKLKKLLFKADLSPVAKKAAATLNKRESSRSIKAYARKLTITYTALIFFIVIACGFTQKNAQEVYVGTVKAGTLEGLNNDVTELYNQALALLESEKGAKLNIKEKITLANVTASKEEIQPISEVVKSIKNKFTYQIEAAEILVNNQSVVTVSNISSAQNVLNRIIANYTDDNGTIIENSFVEDVQIRTCFVNNSAIKSDDEAYKSLMAGQNTEKTHVIVTGDTLWSIAASAGLTLNELLQANPGMTENSILRLGDKINLVVQDPVISVKTTERVIYTDIEPRKTEVVENNNEYKTYRKVLEEGFDGEKEVTAEIVKINGVEESRTVLDEVIIKEPGTETVEVGTLQNPPKKASGSFKYPVAGTLSSPFGTRSGTNHKGIDIASPYGTPVCASDGGTVTYAGWNSGGYGYLVQIDHGNGFVTYYGHNSKIAVKVGDKVYQGQTIAYVGSTGDSDGNHCHFEIRINGTPVNPIEYL